MGSQNERTPLDFDLAEEYQEGFDDSAKHPDRMERYSLAKSNALVNLAQIDKTLKSIPQDTPRYRFLDRTRAYLSRCASYLVFRDYYTVGKIKLVAAEFCKKHLLCQMCAIRWGAKALQKYLERYFFLKAEHPALRMTMITITIKNGSDLKERNDHLKKCISIMLERRRKTIKGVKSYNSHEFAKMFAGVGKIEITKDGAVDGSKSGWHVHAHFTVLHYVTFDWAKFKEEWHDITGDSCVINFAEARHPDEPALDMIEVFKYVVKPSDLTPEETLEVFETLGGKNFLIPFGAFRGVKVPEDLTDEDLLKDLPYIERFYKYLERSGYNLVETRDSEEIKPGDSFENAKTKPKNTTNNKVDVARFLKRAAK